MFQLCLATLISEKLSCIQYFILGHSCNTFTIVKFVTGMFGNIDIGEVNVNDPDSINDDKEYRLLTAEAAVFVE